MFKLNAYTKHTLNATFQLYDYIHAYLKRLSIIVVDCSQSKICLKTMNCFIRINALPRMAKLKKKKPCKLKKIKPSKIVQVKSKNIIIVLGQKKKKTLQNALLGAMHFGLLLSDFLFWDWCILNQLLALLCFIHGLPLHQDNVNFPIHCLPQMNSHPLLFFLFASLTYLERNNVLLLPFT